MTYIEFVSRHTQKNDGCRLGQRFCNDYIKYAWPELFYERDDGKASEMIWEWLKDHDYIESLPEKVIWAEDFKDDR